MEDANQLTILPMIALRGVVVFPGITETIDIGRAVSIAALDNAMENRTDVFVAAQKNAEVTQPEQDDIYAVGCVVRIKQLLRMPGGLSRVVAEGIRVAKLVTLDQTGKFFRAGVVDLQYKRGDATETEALVRKAESLVGQLARISRKMTGEVVPEYGGDPNLFVNRVLSKLLLGTGQKQAVLEITDVDARLLALCAILTKEIEIARLDKKIDQKVKDQIDQNQKEYYLREQIKAISNELGEDDDVAQLQAKIDAANMPAEIKEKAELELRRLARMGATSPDANVARTYIDWLCDVKWGVLTKDNKDMKAARQILDEDHFGMDKIKQRILEYLAVMNLSEKNRTPILCFVGPPGVGKTSVVKSIARALGRKYVRMSLGGLKDEAELRGHRRTYIGAIPGKIVYLLKQAKCMNPVFLFDEIDKMANDFRGDPTSAMLEVLDPEQNSTFNDHYMEVPVDLSKVLFVATANTMEDIPAPLLDRMEVIELSGYTELEKEQIAKRFLIPKQTELNGLKEGMLSLSDDALRAIINDYTRESGVRNLEREIASVCRKVALEILEGATSVKVTAGDLQKYLGVAKYRDDFLSQKDQVGSAIGLAWTPVGGTTLPVDVALFKGKGEVLLTGQLGDVMKESARTAISLVRSLAHKYGIRSESFEKTDIHVHVPEGAIRKDGPSAGVTMATAILSAFSGRAVSSKVAMTGEITLRGKVLPIGGLKEKSLAAYRMGIKKVIIPKDNVKDLEEIPKEVRDKLDFIAAEDISTVFDNALV